MARPSVYKELLIEKLAAGADPLQLKRDYPNVSQSYIYKLGKQVRLAKKADNSKRLSVAQANAIIAPQGFAANDKSKSIRVDGGQTFSQLSYSSLSRHGNDVAEEYLRELRGYRGVQLYKEMGNHPVVAATLAAVKMTLRRVRWFATTPTDKESKNDKGQKRSGEEAKDFLDSVLDDMNISFSDHIDQALSMLQYGFSPFETVYKVRKGDRAGVPGPRTARSKYDDGRIGIRKLAFIGQDTLVQGDSWIFDDRDGAVRGLNQQPPTSGISARNTGPIAIPIQKMILYRTTTERDNPEGRSLLRPMYSSYYFARNLEEIEAISAERMGAGFPVLYLGEDVTKGDVSDSDITEFQKIMKNIRVDEQMSFVIPFAKMGQGMARENSGVLFELVSPPARGNIDFGAIIQRHLKHMAMVGLAQFIHLGMDQQGSQALADVTTDFFQLAVSAWADSMKDTLNRFLVRPLFQLNPEFDPEEHPLIDHSDISTPDLKTIGDYINKTVGAQVIEPDDKLEETIRRVAGFPDKDPSTTRSVMEEQNGDGGTRVSRKEKSKPANNQRNQNPTAKQPRKAETPTAKRPMRASEDTDGTEAFEEVIQIDPPDLYATIPVNVNITMPEQPKQGDTYITTPEPKVTVEYHAPSQKPADVFVTLPEQKPPDVIVKTGETNINYQAPAQTPTPVTIINKVEPTPVEINNDVDVHLPHEVTSTKKVQRNAAGQIETVIEKTKYKSEND